MEDIKFIYAGNENDYEQLVLHHFVSVDHAEKSVLLSIRGTLSLSGAIADMQDMAAEFCYGNSSSRNRRNGQECVEGIRRNYYQAVG